MIATDHSQVSSMPLLLFLEALRLRKVAETTILTVDHSQLLLFGKQTKVIQHYIAVLLCLTKF